MGEAYEERGVWKPWRHPDYREPVSPLQGWWQDVNTGRVVAVLCETTTTGGNPAVQISTYDFNEGSPGTSSRMLVSNFEKRHERLSAEFDPRSRDPS